MGNARSADEAMKIGIIGTGNVGHALATGLTAAGHDVVLGSRDPETVAADVEVGTQRAAAEYGDVVVLALPAGVVTDVAADLRDALAGTSTPTHSSAPAGVFLSTLT